MHLSTDEIYQHIREYISKEYDMDMELDEDEINREADILFAKIFGIEDIDTID